MDKLALYRKIIEEILTEQAGYKLANSDIDKELIMDRERDHYQVSLVGWEGLKRVHSCSIHIDIKGDKVWLQRDYTDAEIAAQLIEKGIPKEDIVLGFHAPYKRPYTGFAIA